MNEYLGLIDFPEGSTQNESIFDTANTFENDKLTYSFCLNLLMRYKI